MSNDDDWDQDDKSKKNEENEFINPLVKKIIGSSDLDLEKKKIELKKEQEKLTKEVSFLSNELQRLRGEIGAIEETKRTVVVNKNKIDRDIQDIEFLKSNIQNELNKLVVDNSFKAPLFFEDEGAPPPPLPPLPPSSALNSTKKFAMKLKTEIQKSEDKKTVDPKVDMLKALSEGVQLKKTNKHKVIEKTQEEKNQKSADEIRRFESSIKIKESEISVLIKKVSEYSTLLETAKENQGKYQEALHTQADFISELTDKKMVLEKKFNDVKKNVGEKLAKIEEKNLVEEEKEELNKNVDTSSVMDEIPLPPPLNLINKDVPSPPPLWSKKIDKIKDFQTKQVEVKEISSSTEKKALSMDGIELKAEQMRQRRETEAIKNHLITKLIDLLLLEGSVSEIDATENQDKLKVAVGENAFTELNDIIQEILSSEIDSPQSNIKNLLQSKFNTDANTLEKNIDHPKIKGSILKFIDNHENRDHLLNVSKDIKQSEEIEIQRLEEIKKIKEDEDKKELFKKQAEIKKIEDEKKAVQVQEKLLEMGVEKGVIDTEGVKNAELEKNAIIKSVHTKKLALKEINNFLDSMDLQLSDKISALEAKLLVKVELEQKEEVKNQNADLINNVIAEEIKEEEIKEEEIKEEPNLIIEDEKMAVAKRIAEEIKRKEVEETKKQIVMNRKALLEKSGFEKHLKIIETEARKLSVHYPEASMEAMNIVIQLTNSKIQFINGTLKSQKFIDVCKNAIEPANTAALSQHGLIWRYIQSAINTILNVFVSSAVIIDTDSMKKIKKIGYSLTLFAPQASTEESTDNNSGLDKKNSP